MHRWDSRVFRGHIEVYTVGLRVFPPASNNPDWSSEVSDGAFNPNGGKKSVQAWLDVAVNVPVIEVIQVSGRIVMYMKVCLPLNQVYNFKG